MIALVGIVDLEMGNLRSVANAVSAVGHDSRMVRAAADLEGISHLVLPGVGSYTVAMTHMKNQGLVEPIRALAASGKPLLGICLGMQLLSQTGDEGGPCEGLGLIEGRVVRLDAEKVPRIPHVGWNEVRMRRAHPVFTKVKSGADFYFVHSYQFVCERDVDRCGVVEYGGSDYTAIVGRDNVLGFQFHPEKSQANGVRLIENFCDWDGTC
jgi:imidazole glycerol-phosphate synthase subunit HisH